MNENLTTAERVTAVASSSLAEPGGGATWQRWRALADLGATDLAVAKLVEPHHDATSILKDLAAPAPRDASLWAVWAAEPPFAKVTGWRDGAGWRLRGTKAFCSGAMIVTDALISADAADGPRLFAVDVAAARGETLAVDEPTWAGAGMRGADTRTVHLADVAAREVGEPGAYVNRPGFWHGAMGIAACWLGGAHAASEPLRKAGRRGRLDPHGLAHLGVVTASTEASWSLLERTAHSVDADPDDTKHRAKRDALVLRTTVVGTVETVIRAVGRALGPGPLAFDGDHAQRIADLQVFIRQDHAERDLAELGALIAEATDGN
ncbi:MAG: acyl-CoA dehydrogenase [Mycobacteriaceae bacterium]